MFKKPEWTCGRCRKPLVERAPGRQLGLDGRTYDLCVDCWRALENWISASGRIREADEAAA